MAKDDEREPNNVNGFVIEHIPVDYEQEEPGEAARWEKEGER
jgi:hypothetical protein